MAKIIPYGDLNAHGSLANSLSFRRRYNYVVLQKKPFPKQPNSAGQIAQRSAFSGAVNDWYFLNSPTKLFYNTRGPELNMTGQNLYIKQKLLNNLPSTTPLGIKDVTNMILNNLRSTQTNGMRWEVNDFPHTVTFGRVSDNGNIFSDLASKASDVDTYLRIERLGSPYAVYQFRDSISLSVISAGSPLDILIRIPALDFNDFAVEDLYMADDGSVYWNSGMTELACVSKF